MLPLADPQRFVGRHRQLVAMNEALESRSRLLTLHGPNGVGKSRLAAEHLHAVRDERRVVPVDLADAVTLRDALSLVATAVGAPAAAGRDPVSVLAEALRGLGPATLVLDHVDDVASALASPVARWLAACPEAHVVVTSARPLAIAEEHVCAVEPLLLPVDSNERVASDALRLWQMLRAGDAKPRERPKDPELVQLLRALSGLPLLIELLAAQAEQLTPSALLERIMPRLRELGSEPAPEAALRAVLDAVWSGASEAERAAFAQCAVFASSFDARAFAAVYEPVSARATPLSADAALERLTRRRLLSRVYTSDGSARFGMHDAVRAYAHERLTRLDRDGATELRHARHYVQHGSALAEALEGREGPEANRALLADQGNLLRLIERAPRAGHVEDATLKLRALCVHDQVLSTYGPADADLERLDAALARGEALNVDVSVLTEAHCVRAFVHARTGAHAETTADLERAKTLTDTDTRRESYDAGRVAVTVAFVHLSAGRLTDADREAVRALAIADRAAHKKLAGIALGIHALVRRVQGDDVEAERLYERALATHREVGNLRYEGIVETRLAQLLLDRGEAARALEAEEHARSLHRMFGDRFMEGLCLNVRGTVDCAEGRLEDARAAFEAAEPMLAAAGDAREATRSLSWQARVRSELGDFDLALSALGTARRGYEALGNAREAELAMARAAGLEALLGAPEAAADKLAALVVADDAPLLAALVEIERAQLDLAELRAARAEGDGARASRARERALTRRAALEAAVSGTSDARFPVRVDARTSLRLFDMLLTAHEPAPGPPLKLSLAGKRFETPRGERVDVRERPALRRILIRLAMHAVRAPGAPHTALELFAAGWPRENPGEENARLQVYAVLGTLRKLGLAELLVADDRGHFLREDVRVELVP